MTAATGLVCRLTVRGPARQVDLAVPVNVLIADLMPVLLHHLGEELPDRGLLHEGWVLQRLGGPALAEDTTVAALGLRDGDVLYLRGRADQLPPVDFDDLIDGLATAVRGRGGRWTAQLTRIAAAGLLCVVLGLGLAVVGLAGHPLDRAGAAAVVAVVCLILAQRVGSTVELRALAVVAVVGAIAYAATAGLLAPGTTTADVVWGTPQVLTAAVAVLGMVVVGIAVLAWARPLLVGVLGGGALAAMAGALGTLTGLGMAEVAAIVAVVATVGITVVPLSAFRLSGLRLAPLPTQPEHLQEDLDPAPGQDVVDRAGQAQSYMTALYAGLAAPTAVALAVLGGAPGWAAPTLATLGAATLALTSRPMTGVWHRLSLLLAAAAGLTSIAVREALNYPQWRAIGTAVLVPAAALLCLLIARVLPGRRLMPYWGRLGDLVHLLFGVAMLPVLLAVLDVYGAVRAIGG